MNELDMCHVMIDLETLGTKPNSVILSIGVVQFSLRGDLLDKFHKGVLIDSCLDAGLQVDGNTIEFWLKQEKENITKLLNLDVVPLDKALAELNKCFCAFDKKLYVWSHGSCFDVVLLENAYRTLGKKIWWKYTNVRDTRTLFDLANYEYKASGTHDAIIDARNQAIAVQEAYRKLTGKEVTIKGMT